MLPLFAIHRRVGRTDQLVELDAICGRERHSDADAAVERVAADGERLVEYGREFPRDDRRVLLGTEADEDDELVSAEAGDEVFLR